FAVAIKKNNCLGIFFGNLVQNLFHQLWIHDAGLMLVTLLIAFGAGRAMQITYRIYFKEVAPRLQLGCLRTDSAINKRNGRIFVSLFKFWRHRFFNTASSLAK